MRYRLGIETTASDRWIAWVLDLPGCYSSGRTRAEVISNAGAAIAAYHQWIARHRHEPPFEDPYMDIHVAEVFQTTDPPPGLETKAFFEEDRLPLDEAELAHVLDLLAFTHADLLALVSQAGSTRPPVGDVLKQVADEECQYLARFGLPCPEGELPDDPLQVIQRIHVTLQRSLSARAKNSRVVIRDGETWSPRKLLRRVMWLERDRAQHITKLVSM